MKKILFTLLLIGTIPAVGQIIHSHNDYLRRAPLTEALTSGAGIIEADLWMRGEGIVVCHDADQVATAPLFTDLYIKPLQEAGHRAHGLKLMADLKEAAVMGPLADLLARYPDLFFPGGVEVIISGERPRPETFASYPDYILFDGRFDEVYSVDADAKVWMASGDIRDHTSWNGKGSIPVKEKQSMQKIVDSLHCHGKTVRFWGTRDNVNSWVILQSMGVDIIGTDVPALCAEFFSDGKSKKYTCSQPLDVYLPTMECDGTEGRVKNIIFFIGDGMGLAQLCAAETANRGNLTILNIPTIGLQKTTSLDYYNTDSAAAGTALFTGNKTENGMVAILPDGRRVENAAERFAPTGRRVGIVSTGDITDATPAANYAHAADRNDSEGVASQVGGNVYLLAGSRPEPFEGRRDGRNLFEELSQSGFEILRSADSIPLVTRATICIDDRFGEYLTADNIGFLADVTRDAIARLDNENGFYLMVESAKIDYAGHANHLPSVVIETLALDLAVAEALKFADREGNTLVVVTGDHETGGLSLLDGDHGSGYINGIFSSDDHTGIMLPVFSYGVGSHRFRGVYPNTEIIRKMAELAH
ncbi:MAG: alkaline phosphatase [Rikenellaceae bacterium]|nr:alkaline phosphatase [Rikenellaceae bacterium]